MTESVKTLIKLGYSEKGASDLANKYSLRSFKDESLKNNIILVYDCLLSLGYTKADIIKMTKHFPTLYGLSKESIQDKMDFLISLGYTKKDAIKMTKQFPALYGHSKENIQDKMDYLISLGYTKVDIIKMTRQFPALYSLSKENIQDKIDFLISLGYAKKDVIKMTRQFPALYGISKESIQDKMNFFISLGYTKADVIKITELLPTLYGLSKENIRDKIEFLKLIELDFIILYDPKKLMQSTKSTYARYKFLTEEKNIDISKENYRKLFINNKQFENAYGIGKKELFERYPYEKEKKEYGRLLIRVRN